MPSHDPSGGLIVLVTALLLGGLLVAVGTGYVAAVRAGNGRGRDWPAWRTACALGGVVLGLVAVGPLGLVGHHDFVAHMAGHLLLGMAAPLLLVCSSPVTAVLRGLPAPAARRLTRLLGSTYVRVVTRPEVAAALDIGGLWLLYTTPLHAWLHSSALVHLVVHAHVLLAGWVFTAAILQRDPTPHPVGHPRRAVVLMAFLALHAILAKHLYAHPPAGVDPDQAAVGAQLMYYGGDYVDLVLIVLLCLDWYRRTAPGRRRRAAGWRPGGAPVTLSDGGFA